MTKEYLFTSDFDQTLSFNDSGLVLSEVLGIPAQSGRTTRICSRRDGDDSHRD